MVECTNKDVLKREHTNGVNCVSLTCTVLIGTNVNFHFGKHLRI